MKLRRQFLKSILRQGSLWGLLMMTACDNKPATTTAPDPQLSKHGSQEITAKLVEIPDGAIFQKDLYDYATILKYEVQQVHRGDLKTGATIYIGHYNPWKPRNEAADKRVKTIGGNLRRFQAGDVHRMALDHPMDEFYLGGIVDKYHGQHESAAYWAVWTSLGP